MMKSPIAPIRVAPGLVLAATLVAAPPVADASAYGSPPAVRPVPPASSTWGVILRNVIGEPTAALRGGPYGRSTPSGLAANAPPPYGVGSLGLLIGSAAEKTDFGNETIFAGLPLRDISVLKYWIYAGMDVPNFNGFPVLSIEVNPRIPALPGVTFTSVNYVPARSAPPSRPPALLPGAWQQYNASGAGSGWYATSGAVQGVTGCTLATPCSFNVLKSRMPNAFVSFSIGISVGTGAPFLGAVDGLQINSTVYDFEPSGVRRTVPRPL